MNYVTIKPPRNSLARRFKGWLSVVRAPQFYQSSVSQMIHRVRHAETCVEDGQVDRVSVHHWCGGMGSVSNNGKKSKGEWVNPDFFTQEDHHNECQRCTAAMNQHARRKNKKKKP